MYVCMYVHTHHVKCQKWEVLTNFHISNVCAKLLREKHVEKGFQFLASECSSTKEFWIHRHFLPGTHDDTAQLVMFWFFATFFLGSERWPAPVSEVRVCLRPHVFFWYTNIFLNRENGLCTTWTLHCTTWTLHKNQTRVDVDLDWVWITCEIYNKQMKKHMINKSLTHRGLGIVFRVWRRDHLWTTQIQKCFIYP